MPNVRRSASLLTGQAHCVGLMELPHPRMSSWEPWYTCREVRGTWTDQRLTDVSGQLTIEGGCYATSKGAQVLRVSTFDSSAITLQWTLAGRWSFAGSTGKITSATASTL